MADVHCRVCNSADARFLCRTFNEHSATRWLENYRCADCGSVFVGNVLTRQELAEAYASLDEKSYYAETAKSSEAKFETAARDLSKIVAKTGAVVDVGGGHGAFTRTLHRHGFTDISIHEIPGETITLEFVRRVFRDTDYSSVPSASFDAVTMMDVLEHVPDPQMTLQAARRMLRPGGVLYLHTPRVTPLDRFMHFVQRLPLLGSIGRAWQRSRTSIFHLQNYTPAALAALSSRSGFERAEIRIVNELSWPVERYVRVYLVEKWMLPASLAPLVSRLLAPLLRSGLNANKAVATAWASPE